MKTARILATITALIAAAALTFSSCDEFNFSFINNGNETPEKDNTGDTTTETPDPDHFWDPVVIDTDGLTKISFTESTDDFANPERGFYYPYEYSSAKTTSASSFKANRTEYRTLVLQEYWLVSFMSGDISSDFLNCVRKNLENARSAGVKCILRFGYKHNSENEKKPWDAEQDIVLRHIQQLKPILQDNSDVILCVQAGFVGVWGEWYYTDHFGMNPTSDSDYEPRRKVLNALLDALPANRQVAVRTPTFKMKIYHLELGDTLTCATAYQNTPKARVCGHNDCFVAASDDWGTFQDDTERRYWEADTKYTIMGGETCATSSYSKCNNAPKQMELQHWTYLNIGYNEDVLDSWTSGGCMPEVKKRLGYRLVMRNAWITPNITAGCDVRAVFSISNVGYAAPINPRGLELVLVDSKGNKTVKTVTTENPRLWLAGKTRLFEVDFKAPAKGNYTLYLNLPDPESTLHDNPYYSIRLANNNVWQESTGYNKITTFEVK